MPLQPEDEIQQRINYNSNSKNTPVSAVGSGCGDSPLFEPQEVQCRVESGDQVQLTFSAPLHPRGVGSD